jgi:hypothetical protein
MNKNVLLRMKKNGVAIPTKSVIQLNNNAVIEPDINQNSINKNKYNPDVMKDYEKIKDYKISDIEYSNETWKGITGDKMEFNVDSSMSFVMAIDKGNTQVLKSEFEEEYALRERERIAIEEKNIIIRKKMMQNVMKLVDEICDDNTNIDEVVNFDELKICGNTTSHMVSAHSEYNNLLN